MDYLYDFFFCVVVTGEIWNNVLMPGKQAAVEYQIRWTDDRRLTNLSEHMIVVCMLNLSHARTGGWPSHNELSSSVSHNFDMENTVVCCNNN